MITRASIFVTITCATVLLASGYSSADSLRTVVERGMIAPGSNKEFLSFGQLNGVGPAISGENVAFGGAFNGGAGYYALIDGTLTVLADTEMTIPGTEAKFGFRLFEGSDPAISGRRVAFYAIVPTGSGLWVWRDGELELIVATNLTIVPGTEDVTFRNFGTLEGASPSISGENVAFASLLNSFQNNARPGDGAERERVAGESEEEQGGFASGVYAYINGELRVIADTDTIVPGENVTFTSFEVTFGVSPSISGENVAFFGEWLTEDLNTKRAIWAYINGSLELIARSGDASPGGGSFGTFGFLSGFSPSISGESVAFFDNPGIYARINGELRLIANTSSDPGPSAQQIGPFVAPHISGENVVFAAGNPSGIYAFIDDTLKRVVDTSTVVPGHDVVFLGNIATAQPSISGTNIAFSGIGEGPGINGVYVLSKDPPAVPGQSDWSVMAVTLLLLAAASTVIVRRLLSPARQRS